MEKQEESILDIVKDIRNDVKEIKEEIANAHIEFYEPCYPNWTEIFDKLEKENKLGEVFPDINDAAPQDTMKEETRPQKVSLQTSVIQEVVNQDDIKISITKGYKKSLRTRINDWMDGYHPKFYIGVLIFEILTLIFAIIVLILKVL